jgi:hypothetical protein
MFGFEASDLEVARTNFPDVTLVTRMLPAACRPFHTLAGRETKATRFFENRG